MALIGQPLSKAGVTIENISILVLLNSDPFNLSALVLEYLGWYKKAHAAFGKPPDSDFSDGSAGYGGLRTRGLSKTPNPRSNHQTSKLRAFRAVYSLLIGE